MSCVCFAPNNFEKVKVVGGIEVTLFVVDYELFVFQRTWGNRAILI
jgi:hypothetical protein